MAWTTPRTWVPDETMTATLLNTHVRDNLNALYGTDSTYTPTVAQGVSTNIAKTVNEARYVQEGRVVTVWLTLTLTAGGTAGSGFTLTLPVAASGHFASAIVGSGGIFNASSSTYDAGLYRLASTTTVSLGGDGRGGFWGASPNEALASTDVIFAILRYMVA